VAAPHNMCQAKKKTGYFGLFLKIWGETKRSFFLAILECLDYFGFIRQMYTFIFCYSKHIFNWRWSNMFRTLYEVHLQGHLF
jgi:hypothetical protein